MPSLYIFTNLNCSKINRTMEGWLASTSWTKSCWHPTKRTGSTVRQVSAHVDHAHATLFPSTWERPVSPQGSAFSHCSHTLFQLAVFRGILRRDLLLDLGLPLFLARDFMFHCGDCGGLKKKMYSQWKEKKLQKCPPKNTYDLSGSDKHKMSFPCSWASIFSEKE